MKKKIIFILFFVLLSLSISETVSANPPKWASEQLYLRSLAEQGIRETQEWQVHNGSIFPYLNIWKLDDEVEIFYFWLHYYFLTGDESVYKSVKDVTLSYINRALYKFDHGYYGESFFDTEHTLEGMITLANLVWAKPDDQQIVAALEDVVEHCGNWVSDCEPWFNEETGHMRSLSLGTQEVLTNCNEAVDWVFNLQFVKMALAAYYATEKTRYYDWAQVYLDGWIQTIEKNEQQNGYYVLPSSVDPYTGKIAPYSNTWYCSAFGPGWGWSEKGNNANRDIRGAFIDFYRFSGEKKYLESVKKQIQTLFDNGVPYQPAHYFDGQNWITANDKVTARMGVQTSLFNDTVDTAFDNYIQTWYEYLRYPYPEMHLWSFRKYGGSEKIDEIQSYAIHGAERQLSKLKTLTQLPSDPDDFPEVGGLWGLAFVPFGGITSHRGEMPWTEVMYFKSDKSLGLPDGVAALFQNRDADYLHFSVSNTTSTSKEIWVKAGFLEKQIKNVWIDGSLDNTIENNLAHIVIPPETTVTVKMEYFVKDSVPPAAPQNVRIITAQNQ